MLPHRKGRQNNISDVSERESCWSSNYIFFFYRSLLRYSQGTVTQMDEGQVINKNYCKSWMSPPVFVNSHFICIIFSPMSFKGLNCIIVFESFSCCNLQWSSQISFTWQHDSKWMLYYFPRLSGNLPLEGLNWRCTLTSCVFALYWSVTRSDKSTVKYIWSWTLSQWEKN